ncbi:MAG: branched-chain amino acid ABC transporter permease [Aquabacterium sp.]|jgi:branched-chain amino acid transport system permease protein|uniref:branched-chain amino acid ABC transporter permease n=1 Tax=Aquabacterium sp. TaxID=1872578 RepID=UPI001B5FAE35|nr:branched-chain amino acid ABC transporter permease [Aquabacterium sp.]MBP7133065.1 branched-chain amino acid ABC transporter permease [Aquabacterium sp.]MBP9063462.1 branched-chain amino acid ABC transporter permease [Aquabacterium sp.]
METFFVFALNGLSYGLLLFMLSSGLTLIFSMMGVLNFAHTSFYMLGAYFAHALTGSIGFFPALIVAPLLVGALGAAFERYAVRKVHPYGHVPELLVTFGLSYVVLEVVRLVWGPANVDYRVPEALGGAMFTLVNLQGQELSWFAGAADAAICATAGNSCTPFPLYRGFMALVALAMLVALWLLLTRTRIGLIIQAALTHPEMTQSLGHNVPRVMMGVFGGGCALAGLAGVIGGNAFVTEPNMAASVGAIIFVVVVVGGMGSLAGAFLASILIGLIQTFAVVIDVSVVSVMDKLGSPVSFEHWAYPILKISVSEMAPILPYLLLVLILIFRPKGLLGTREE